MLKKSDKILFISQYAGFIGGLEVYINSTAKLLRENGFKTASLYVEKTKGAEKFLADFDETYDIGQLDKISQKDFNFTTLHKISSPEVLQKILARFSPTVFVHDHDYFCPKGYKYFPYKRINCTLAHSRIFCGVCSSIVPPRHIVNGMGAMLKKNFCESAALCKLIKTAPKFVVLSDFMKRELAVNSISKNKITVLHPFLKSTFEDSIKNDKKSDDITKIVFVGQQVMSKGTPLFLEALTRVKSSFKADILGAGPRLKDFKKLSEDLGLGEKVAFHGWVNNPDEFTRDADFTVFPSLWQEPFGLTGIEAMAHGIPVIAFDVGGVSEWLKDGVNGILIKERDTVSMTEAIDKLIKNETLRKSLGKTAKKIAEKNYSAETFLNNFVKLI